MMIVTKNLTKTYKKIKAVDNLNIRIDQGEIFGLLGPNGAGKTTTIRILTTLTKPTSGKAVIDGHDVLENPIRVKNVIGVVQQSMSLDRDLTIQENMEAYARMHHIPGSARNQRIDELLDYVELINDKSRMVTTLSGGMKRRLMIARALLHHPKLLFLDEPTVGLDAQTRRRIWELIRRLNLNGTSLLLTTHYIEEAEALCGRVGVIDYGRLIAIGTPLELRHELGMTAVETISPEDKTLYKYFPDSDSARSYAQGLSGNTKKIIVRDSNLEDVFIELTGRKVAEN